MRSTEPPKAQTAKGRVVNPMGSTWCPWPFLAGDPPDSPLWGEEQAVWTTVIEQWEGWFRGRGTGMSPLLGLPAYCYQPHCAVCPEGLVTSVRHGGPSWCSVHSWALEVISSSHSLYSFIEWGVSFFFCSELVWAALTEELKNKS